MLKYQKSKTKVFRVVEKELISKKILKNTTRDKIDYSYVIIDLNY